MKIATRQISGLVSAVLAASTLLISTSANAIPSFARQTGMGCAACHFGGNFYELNKTGREFKLMGYTLGNRQSIPLAAMLQVSATKVSSHNGYTDADFSRDGEVVPQQVSVFAGGKITDQSGAFVQWTYDGIAHHSNLDNTDIRYADKATFEGKDLIYGVTLNNGPSIQDVFNTTSAWGFPFAAPPIGAPTGYPSTLIDGGLAQQVAGIGVYGDWDGKFLAELSGYKTADGIFSFLRAGGDTVANRYPVKGTSPYWRLAYHSDEGAHSWAIGAYGMVADRYSDTTNASSPTSRFKDTALDAQWQFSQEKDRYSVQATWIHEKTNWDSSLAYSNSSDKLDTYKIKGSYFYHNKVGGSIGLFSTSGSQDTALYVDSNAGSPDTRGYILEADYLPVENIKLALQYTGYTKYNGSSSNYDPAATGSRNAKDNNTLYLLGWFMF